MQIKNIFEGKSPTERNKIIAAAVLGVLSLLSLAYAFGPGLFRSSASVKVSASPTPRPSATPGRSGGDTVMPSQTEQNFAYTTVPVVYDQAMFAAPEPGRNIFAFYEPPPPCPTCPTPPPPPVPVKTPTPTPTPDIMITLVNPQSVYAGSKGFRLEIAGERIEPTARVYLSQTEIPSSFVSDQRMVADVPASLIASEGPRQIIIQTSDGKKHSNVQTLTVQAPPKPQFQYIGMLGRKRYNNDTAYFMEEGKQTPTAARLTDIVGGRFRLVSISPDETVFEDVSLGFRHKVGLYRPPPGTAAVGGPPARGTFPGRGNYVPYNPNSNTTVPTQGIPGIPDNIPRYVPPTNAPPPPQDKRGNDDDNDDGQP